MWSSPAFSWQRLPCASLRCYSYKTFIKSFKTVDPKKAANPNAHLLHAPHLTKKPHWIFLFHVPSVETILTGNISFFCNHNQSATTRSLTIPHFEGVGSPWPPRDPPRTGRNFGVGIRNEFSSYERFSHVVLCSFLNSISPPDPARDPPATPDHPLIGHKWVNDEFSCYDSIPHSTTIPS